MKEGGREGERPTSTSSSFFFSSSAHSAFGRWFSFLLMCAVLLAMISHKSLYPSSLGSDVASRRLFWGKVARNC